MGTRCRFVCPACGYATVVSGGDDCGFFVATRTVVCNRCEEVMDVVGSETPWDAGSTASYCFLRCPSCDGGVRAWHGRACPRCGKGMELDPDGPVIQWD